MQTLPLLVRMKRAVRRLVPRPLAARINRLLGEIDIRRRTSGFVTPRQNRPLSEAEFQRAKLICREVAHLISNRARYVEENGLDTDFCLPDANWKGEGDRGWLYHGTTALLREDYEIINNLRLFSQIFSGYSLLEMTAFPRRAVPPDRVPADLLDRMLARSRRVDEWVARYREMSRQVPDALRVSPPNRFGESGWIFDGRIVNHDTTAYLERVALLHAAGLLEALSASDRAPRILEIGGGYGGLAYHLKTLVPGARYIVVDLPESLLFSALYLTTLFPDERNVLVTSPEMIRNDLEHPGFTFVPNYLLRATGNGDLRLDLAINTLSLSEMTASQVRSYCVLVRDSLAPGGAFFEQNQDNRHLGLLNAELLIAESFRSRRRLSLPCGVTQGQPNVWAP